MMQVYYYDGMQIKWLISLVYTLASVGMSNCVNQESIGFILHAVYIAVLRQHTWFIHCFSFYYHDKNVHKTNSFQQILNNIVKIKLFNLFRMSWIEVLHFRKLNYGAWFCRHITRPVKVIIPLGFVGFYSQTSKNEIADVHQERLRC